METYVNTLADYFFRPAPHYPLMHSSCMLEWLVVVDQSLQTIADRVEFQNAMSLTTAKQSLGSGRLQGAKPQSTHLRDRD